METKKVLVIGASGYVGSRLVPRLCEKGYAVRAAARSAERLKKRPWINHPSVEPLTLDVLDRDSLREACRGCFAAYYLVHSMNPAHQKDFEQTDRAGAMNMAWAAEQAQLERIIYLGGLGEEKESLSRHLRSRIEVGKTLKSGKTPVTILRAAMIIGCGSLAFEILRHLAGRFKFILAPLWITTQSQPIAIQNTLDYLTGCLEAPETAGQTFDIGGPDIVNYRELINIYANEAFLSKRYAIACPFLTPNMSARWISIVTPVPGWLLRPLANGLKNRLVCKDNRIRELIPQRLLDSREAVRAALNPNQVPFENRGRFQKEWIPPPEWKYEGDPDWVKSVQ